MLRSLKDLEHYQVEATDGAIGDVERFLLDDERWIVRYLVVKTGGFFDGRRVLISPASFRQADWSTQRFHLALTMDGIKASPNIDPDLPVLRQNEPTIRSDEEIRGYKVQGSDEAIGHVEDFIVDDETWQVRYLVIDTSNWWFGKKVLVAPQWTSSISRADGIIHVAMTRQAIKASPEWNETTATLNRNFEARLYDYYGRPVYWGDGDRLVRASKTHSKSHSS